jgi:hypothetical protein
MKPMRLAWLIFAFFVALFIFAPAIAEPMYEVRTDKAVITIYSEACAMPEVVNLSRRATWVEGAKTYEGCAGIRPDFGLVVFYFSDRTVGVVPISQFVKVTTS